MVGEASSGEYPFASKGFDVGPPSSLRSGFFLHLASLNSVEFGGHLIHFSETPTVSTQC
jgi:hypothetical protein